MPLHPAPEPHRTDRPPRPALLKDHLDAAALQRWGAQALAQDAGWAGLSVMQRVARLGAWWDAQFSPDLATAVQQADALGAQVRSGFEAMALAAAIGRRQHEALPAVLAGLAVLTRHGTSEFAIRPWLARDPEAVLAQALRWTTDPDEHVRRLASEGTRPRLPWGQRLDGLARTPERLWPVLDALRDDPSAYVRRSVANHLGDIAKVNPGWVLDRLAGWPLDRPGPAWIARHAVRVLVKAGHPRALALWGAGAPADVVVEAFSAQPARVALGGSVTLHLRARASGEGVQRWVVDLAIHFARPQGPAPKVFKWRVADLAPGEVLAADKRFDLVPRSTRRLHPGLHRVTVQVNGRVLAESAFTLDPADGPHPA